MAYTLAGLEEHATHELSAGLETPTISQASDGQALLLQGWAVGHDSRLSRLLVYWETELLAATEISGDRADVAAAHPGHPHATACGFRTAFSLIGLPSESTLAIVAVDDDGRRFPLWTLRISRAPSVCTSTELEPIVVTTLGRTGSTLVMALLAQHPDIIVYAPFESEPRMLTYWLRVVQTLSTPANYMNAVLPLDLANPRWWLEAGEAPLPFVPEPSVERWLVGDQVDAVVRFALEQVEGFYKNARKDSDARLFAEKFLPDPTITRLLFDVYPKVREILLVRDFRDMLSSMLAMDRMRGYHGFGRTGGQSDESYIADLAAAAGLLQDAARERAETAVIVRFEDLVQDQTTELRRILEYLGVDASAATIEKMIDGANRLPEDMRPHITSGSGNDAIGRWTRDLTEAQQRASEQSFGDVLATFGYMTDDDSSGPSRRKRPGSVRNERRRGAG